ncbi:MAG TPA: hypothetical protein VHU84_19785 [Lacipirellulaceae bacterium]|jgi:hypothetical protein|nr:hypothetical protein [Lacipirellulaceae bacterium]
MVRWLIFVLICTGVVGLHCNAIAAATGSRPSIEWEKTDEGETAFVPMKSAPFPHPSRDKGFVYNKVTIPRDPHYTDSTVGLFVPRGFRRTPKTNVLVYLHGWSNNVRKAIAEYKLREQIAASGQNIILIFPEGPRDATDSGCGKLEDKDGLKNLVEESLAKLHGEGKIGNEKIGHVLIAGHSGAYRGLACCADHGGLDAELTGVCLLDSSYGNLDMFVNWVQKHPSGQFFSIFTDHLAAQNVFLFTHVQKVGEHPALQIDTDATDDMLQRSRTLFLHTETLKHDETVQWLERWLRTRKLS